MKFIKEHLNLYAVTDRQWTTKESLYCQVEKAIKGGITCVQLREKNLEYTKFLKQAVEIKILCNTNNIPFIINDDVSIAIECQADGVHIGQSDDDMSLARKKIGKNMILGISVQNVDQALYAQQCGADYLGVGAIFTTNTKLDADAVSLETLKQICDSVKIPIVAIGGINKNNINKLKNTGINGVALVSAIFANDDITKECLSLKYTIDQMLINGN